jgi:hypothetical protein
VLDRRLPPRTIAWPSAAKINKLESPIQGKIETESPEKDVRVWLANQVERRGPPHRSGSHDRRLPGRGRGQKSTKLSRNPQVTEQEMRKHFFPAKSKGERRAVPRHTYLSRCWRQFMASPCWCARDGEQKYLAAEERRGEGNGTEESEGPVAC